MDYVVVTLTNSSRQYYIIVILIVELILIGHSGRNEKSGSNMKARLIIRFKKTLR